MRMVHQGIKELYEYAYDHVGRKTSFTHNSQVVAKYEYDGIGRLQTKRFKPVGTSQGSKQTGNWTDASSWLSGFLPLSNDNVTINTGHTLTIPNGQIASAGVLNDKGILKNFGTLNMGKAPNADLYAETYKYHIRGGLIGKNLDANNNLTNALFSFKLGYEDDGTYFDGNIRNQYWKSNIDGVQRAYEYSYDGASRITQGGYASTKAGENYALNAVSYDLNGNITALSRNGLKSNNSFGLIDNLAYTYQANSNKIQKVDDLSNETASFTDATGATDYTYSLDGSLTSDANKGITVIEYNYLKRPKKITFSNTQTIEYQYDALGKKLREKQRDGTIMDYPSNLVFKNNVLYQIGIDEGRINAQNEYEYAIQDHLGNIRTMFRDSLGFAKITQTENFGAWGEDLPTLSYLKPLWKQDNFKQTGKELLSETGYTDFGARFYDNIVPRFITQDEKAEKWNLVSPYSYVLNNPLSFVDVDGKDIYIWYNARDENGNTKQAYFRFNGKNADSAPMNMFVQNVLKAYNYNAKNGGGENGIEAATNASLAISVSDANGEGDFHSDGYVHWNPYHMMKSGNGLFFSAATAFEHELDHAVHSAKFPIEHAKLKRQSDDLYTNMEEKRVITGSEKETATKNKEIKKGQSPNSHKGTDFESSDPTTNKYNFGQKNYEVNQFFNRLLQINPNISITIKQ